MVLLLNQWGTFQMMNPETNQFEEVQPKPKYADASRELLASLEQEFVRQDGSVVPKEYPVFKVGEELTFKGYRFKVKRIGKDELVFAPVGVMPKTKVKNWSKKQSGRAQKKNKRKKRR